ncbi:MAG TPA: CGNR zinc finger domain-containing protein, partial [Streptosporangiaceae bacterium]|nr:CGNR zinc finger domain-containing protein [Streptosporangiaceae bacterium]
MPGAVCFRFDAGAVCPDFAHTGGEGRYAVFETFHEPSDLDEWLAGTSRPGARRWCAMELCGNRHKLRALRARRTRTRDRAGPGVTTTIPASIRNLVRHRDRHCRWPGCRQPAAVCEVHHVRHKANGGRT